MRVTDTPLHRFAADCISTPDRFERSNKAIYLLFFIRIKRQTNDNKYRSTKHRDFIQRQYRYGSTYECFYTKTQTHFTYMYTHAIICSFFCTYIQIFAHCNCLSFSKWYIYCVTSLLSHLLWIYHVCAFVCTHMCVHMCVYIRFTYTHHARTYFHVHMRTKSYAYTNTDQHSFICSFVWLYICLCAMHYFYMYTPVPTSALIFCDCNCAWAYFYCIHIYSTFVENDDAMLMIMTMLMMWYAEVRRFIFTVMHISICFIYMMIIFGNSTYFLHIIYTCACTYFVQCPCLLLWTYLYVFAFVLQYIMMFTHANYYYFFVWCSCTLLYMYSYVHSFLPFTINRLYCLYIVYIINFVQW